MVFLECSARRTGLTHVLVALLISGLMRPTVALAAPIDDWAPRVVLNATGPKVAIVVVGLDPKARAQAGILENAAEAAALRTGRFTLVSSPEAFNPRAAKRRAEKAAAGQQKLAAGKQALDDLDNVKATEAFVDALELLKDADSTRSFGELVEAWVFKAASHATGGETAAAKKDIEGVLGISPKAEFNPTYFSPDFIKFAEAQRKLVVNARGELTVSTTPMGARVWVDGAFQGVSPVTVAGLSANKHLVAAAAAGTELTQVELGPGDEQLTLQPAELAPEWKTAKGLISSDPEGPGRDSGARDLAKAMGVDQVLLVEAKKSTAGEQLELIVVRIDSRDGHNWAFRSSTVNPGKPDALAQFFDLAFIKDTLRNGKAPVTHYKEGSSDRFMLSLGLIGAGVVAGITGGVFGFMANDRANAWRQTKQTETNNSLQLKTQGQSFAVVADISYLVAIAAAATGTVLLVTNTGNAVDSSPSATQKDDEAARRREDERKAAEERRKADAARREDERRAEEARKAESDKKRAEDDERKKKDDEAARKAADDDERVKKAADDDAKPRKLTRKQREEEERKRKEEEREQKKRRDEEAREEKKRRDEEARRGEKKAPPPDDGDSSTSSGTAGSAADDERKKREEDDRRRIEEDKRKKEEADRKKKKEEDHDDLRNY